MRCAPSGSVKTGNCASQHQRTSAGAADTGLPGSSRLCCDETRGVTTERRDSRTGLIYYSKSAATSRNATIFTIYTLFPPFSSVATLFRTSSPGWQHICENFYNTHLCNSHTQRAVSNFTEHRLEYHRGTEDRRTTLFGIGSATFDSMGRKSTCADSGPLPVPALQQPHYGI